MDEEQVFEFQGQVANELLFKLNKSTINTTVTEAMQLLIRRMVGSGDSLRTLQKNAPHAFELDGSMLLRGIYDAMLQGLYILHDKKQQVERAQRYLDFYWIEHRKIVRILDNNPTFFARQMSQSPKRAVIEPTIDQEFQKVRSKFEGQKGELVANWYGSNLHKLSEQIGRKSEYEILQKLLSSAVHSSSFALKCGPVFKGFFLFDLAWRFLFRVLGKMTDYLQIDPGNAKVFIEMAEDNVFEMPKV